MTIQEVLAEIDENKPNQYEEGTKLRWLNTIENKVYQTMIKREGEEIDKPNININSDYEDELLLPDSFTDIYIHYLSAMIDYHNGETQRYNNSSIMFDNEFSEFENYWYREHRQKCKGTFRR